MWPEVLDRNKSAACLSAWQVSQLALGLEIPDAVEHRHGCDPCDKRVVAEQQENESCAVERVPAMLLSRAGTQPWQRRVRLPPVVLVCLAGVLAFILLGRFAWIWWHAPGRRATVVASVTRDGATVIESVPIASVGPLHGGDKVRLRVNNTRARWVRLQGQQQGGPLWDTYYEGPLPQDGWLPAGFTAMPLSKMRLRLLACPTAMSQGTGSSSACQSEQFEL